MPGPSPRRRLPKGGGWEWGNFKEVGQTKNLIYAEELETMDFESTCFLGDGFIGIKKTKDFTYDIPLNRCRTQAEILHWTAHLSLKTWITREMLRDFIQEAYSINNFEYY